MKNVKNIKRNGGTSMNLKRIAALLAALALAVSMAACQKAPAEPDATPSDSSAASSTAEESEKPSAATGTKGSTASSGKDAAPADEPTESSENGQKETTPGSSSGSEKPTGSSRKPTEKPQQPSESSKPTEPKPTAHQHSYKTTTVAATCTTGGYALHECACGASYKDGQTAALGHSYADTVVAPTTTAQGYTEHTCSRCGDSYKDSYTDPVRWDTEEVVARICEQGNDYVRSLGLTVDPRVGSWVAPQSTTGWIPEGISPEAWLLQRIKEGIDMWAFDPDYPRTRFNVTYGPKDGGGWYIYVMYGL